jgi:hypothetical protein
LLSYYLIYIIFILFPVTQKCFGSNIILPFLILAAICYYGLYKIIHKSSNDKKSNLKLTKTVDKMNRKADFGQAVFSYLSNIGKPSKV